MISRSVRFHFTVNVLFVPHVERRNLGFVCVCTQIVGSVVLYEFAQRFFNSCFHFHERGLQSCATQIVRVYEAMCSVMERLVVRVDVEKDGDRTLPCGKPFFCFLHLLHCSVPHRTSYWTACSGLLYIVGCLQICCRVSVLGLYGSL